MRNKLTRLLPLLVIAVLVLAIAVYLRPVPSISPKGLTPVVKTAATGQLPWPSYGQAALGAQDYGVLENHGTQTAVPMASVAKVVTALAVLEQKPLKKVGETGPTITLNSSDIDAFNSYYSQGGSVIAVSNGEQISEYQALQGLLLPSANNMATTLTNWAFGSNDAYLKYANDYVKKLGLKQTTVADASGFSPQTVSSAQDLVLLGEEALRNPVLAQIVSQNQATLPVAGTVKSTNWLLGVEGVRGIKTGNTDQAGGCYLFAADRTVFGQKITVVGAVMGAPDLNSAIASAKSLVIASDGGFKQVELPASKVVGTYKLPWGGSVNAVTANKISLLNWQDKGIVSGVNLDSVNAGDKKGKVVGSWDIRSKGQTKSVPIVLSADIPSPSVGWRLFR
jgi:D-alanyl-D-alanine carboxypeptidase (penicillin-binding protein 5/6)